MEKLTKIREYDIGICFNGYPLDDIHDKIHETLIDTIPLESREVKNLHYKVVLYAYEDNDIGEDNKCSKSNPSDYNESLQKSIPANTILYTKDGEVIGNAIVKKVLGNNKYELQSDYGSIFILTYNEIVDWYKIGKVAVATHKHYVI